MIDVIPATSAVSPLAVTLAVPAKILPSTLLSAIDPSCRVTVSPTIASGASSSMVVPEDVNLILSSSIPNVSSAPVPSMISSAVLPVRPL